MEPAERLGTVIADKYRLDEVLGRGGMGAVYRATHTKVGKRFAVKILHAEIAEHREAARRFLQEAQASSRIGHPAILDVYDAGEGAKGELYMVTELLEGESLAQRVARGPLPVVESVLIAEQVLEALEAAHKAGVVHRDVKPHNIFLVETPIPSEERPSAPSSISRRVKLLDFGIAKFTAADTSALTRTGTLIGSPLYMAPEQAKAEPDVDARADVWSVGATLFEMLVGTPAHAAPTPVAVVARILMSPAPAPSTLRPEVEPQLDVIVTRALTIDREGRFPSAAAMRSALVAYRTGTAETAASTPPPSLQAESRRARVDPTLESTPPTAATGAGASRSGTGARVGRGAILLFAVGLGAAAALGAAWVRRAQGEDAVGTAPEGTATHAAIAESAGSVEPMAASAAPSAVSPAPSSASSGAPAPSGSEGTSPLATGAPPGPAESAPTAHAAPSAARSASSAVVAANAKHPAAPSCAAGEHLSSGHCCARGLEWQVDRCDRPLATTVPF